MNLAFLLKPMKLIRKSKQALDTQSINQKARFEAGARWHPGSITTSPLTLDEHLILPKIVSSFARLEN